MAALAGAACSDEQLAIGSAAEGDANDFGRSELMEATAELAEAPESAEAFRVFADEVEALRPRFNQRIAALAELRLTMGALGPLRAHHTDPPAEQLEALATTVWPVALRVEPETGEAPADYARRVCEGALAAECRHVVPEYWPEILAAEVWSDLAERAREAVLRCQHCSDPSYAAALAAYGDFEADAIERALDAEKAGHPSQWPSAVGEPAPLAAETVLSISDDGTVRIDGQRVLSGDWRRALRDGRGDGEKILGVHLEPDMNVGRLRELLADARAAGFSQVALIAREPRFPYARRGYQLPASPAALRQLPLRDSDAVQLLVQFLGAGR